MTFISYYTATSPTGTKRAPAPGILDLPDAPLVTLWDSIDAIRRFAGDEHERARYYPEDDAYLLEREERVVHAEVVAATGLAAADTPEGGTAADGTER